MQFRSLHIALNGVKLTPRSKTSAPSLRLRKFTIAYVIGVANTSYTTFAIYPDKIRFTIVQAGSRPANSSTITITVSTACPATVEPTVRVHKYLPEVSSFIFDITNELANSPAQ